MRKITPELTSELYEHFSDPNKVASGTPFKVSTFRELVEHTARLSYRNKDHMLFYRGQSGDYKNKAGSSTFYPTKWSVIHTVVAGNSVLITDGKKMDLITAILLIISRRN